MKLQTEYSQLLGRSKNFLSAYRHSRKIPPSVDADGLYIAYLEEKETQETLLLKLQTMYYELKDARRITAFSDHLIDKGFIKNRNSFQYFTQRYFFNCERIRNKNFIVKHEKILQLYKEWK